MVQAGLTYNPSPCIGIVMGVLAFYFYLLPDYSAMRVFFVVCHEASSIDYIQVLNWVDSLSEASSVCQKPLNKL